MFTTAPKSLVVLVQGMHHYIGGRYATVHRLITTKFTTLIFYDITRLQRADDFCRLSTITGSRRIPGDLMQPRDDTSQTRHINQKSIRCQRDGALVTSTGSWCWHLCPVCDSDDVVDSAGGAVGRIQPECTNHKYNLIPVPPSGEPKGGLCLVNHFFERTIHKLISAAKCRGDLDFAQQNYFDKRTLPTL